MRIRRAGTRRGESATWYVWANRLEEQIAIRNGVLEDHAPDRRWRFVLAWGFGSQRAAAAWVEEHREEVERIVADVLRQEIRREAGHVVSRILADEARTSVHQAELRVLLNRLDEIVGTLGSSQLLVVVEELGKWVAESERLYDRLVGTVQLACVLAGIGISYSDGEKPSPQPSPVGTGEGEDLE